MVGVEPTSNVSVWSTYGFLTRHPPEASTSLVSRASQLQRIALRILLLKT